MNVTHQTTTHEAPAPVVSFQARKLEFGLVQQTYNTKITLGLAGINLVQRHANNDIKMIWSPGFHGGEEYLIKVRFTQVNKTSPEFHSTYKSCEVGLVLEFAKLNIILHKEGLLSLIQYATGLQDDVNEIWGDKAADRIASARGTPAFTSQLSTISEGIGITAPQKPKKKTDHQIVVETIKFKLSSSLKELTVEFQTDLEQLSRWSLIGVNADVIIKTSYTQINAHLNQIVITDLNPDIVHQQVGTDVCWVFLFIFVVDFDGGR